MERFHAERLRQGRISLPGQIYLVTTVTHHRRPLFFDLFRARIVVNALRHQDRSGSVATLAYVLMPDHLHWLFSLSEDLSLSKVMRSVKGYSGRFLHSEGANGRITVWQKGFHDHALRRDEDVKTVARYLVLNPVRAGIVTDIWQYPHWDAVWVGQ